jgi:hypothetical protein
MPSPLSTPTPTDPGDRAPGDAEAPPKWLDGPRPPEVPWETLGPEFFNTWGRPNGTVMPEHLTVYGPSGSGKTYFITYVMTVRANLRGSHAVVIATKRADPTLETAGWPIIDKWPPDYGQNQVIFWTRAGLTDEDQAEQRARVFRLLNQLWVPDSNMMVNWDELPYIVNDLGLRRVVGTYYREGRANGITNIAGAQRPADVTRYPHSEAGWTVAFKPKDQDDRKRVAEVFGNRRYYMDVLKSLDRERHQFVIKRELTGDVFISSLPATRPVLIKRENQPR